MKMRYILLMMVFLKVEFYFSQLKKCSLYIYSEFDDYTVYIDDILKGKNVNKIDSIDCGEHYIKVTYQNVIIFSEILQFNENQLKKILLRKTKDIEEKLLSSKSKEIAEYRRRKISIGLNKQYVTTTDVNLNQYTYKPLFGGNYYGLNYSGNISGVQFSVSEEKIKDWFFIEGGYERISDYTFIKNHCELTKNCLMYNNLKTLENDINDENKKIHKFNKKLNILNNIVMFFLVIGTIAMCWGIIEMLISLFLGFNTALILSVGGLVILIISVILGTIILKKMLNYRSLPNKLITLKEALKMIDEYNAELKKQLGLPENFD